ncbi:MAG TPA: hypothetical protein VHK01_13255, partial [Lacipirellulaceae bacterium]|nr:hypothetical protein [Lacipirellulaceae bacterium]
MLDARCSMLDARHCRNRVEHRASSIQYLASNPSSHFAWFHCMFEKIEPAPSDPILGLTEAFKADPNP